VGTVIKGEKPNCVALKFNLVCGHWKYSLHWKYDPTFLPLPSIPACLLALGPDFQAFFGHGRLKGHNGASLVLH
jgi:hypothetical protein